MAAKKQRKTWKKPSESAAAVEEVEMVHDHYLLSFNKKTYQKDYKVQNAVVSMLELERQESEQGKEQVTTSTMAVKKNESNPIIKSSRDPKINFFHTLPSVQKDTQNLKEYALRNSLNQMEPQMQKYKLRKDIKSAYQK